MTDQQMPNEVNEAIKYHRQLASISDDFTSKLVTIHDFSLQLANYMSGGWWIHALRLIDEHSKNLPDISFLPLDKAKQTSLREYALEMSRQEQRRFPKLFEDACQHSDIPLDDSPHPRYTCDNHFIKITVDEAKQVAKIENHETELSTIPMDIAAIVYELAQIRKRLFAREFDAVDFVERLFQDYKAVLASEELKQGDAVRIRSITKRRGKNIKGFRVDEFSVDLFRLLKDGVTETKEGYRLRLEQTKNTNQGMLLPGGQGYIGFIRFEK